MKVGINHQILPGADRSYYDAWWAAVSPWVDVIRCDTMMSAYAWAVDPKHVYSNNQGDAMKPWRELGVRANIAGVQIDLIRDGFPSSEKWRALGGDWSSFDPPNTWREWCVPKVAWTKVNAWVNEVAKTLRAQGAACRWQGPNESFDRGHDTHSFERTLNVYAQPSYGCTWTGPALWGPRVQLLRQLDEWWTLRKYNAPLSKASKLAVNIYPDYVPGVTVDTESNLRRLIENFVLVDRWASQRGVKVVVPEFGFAHNQVDTAALRVDLTAFALDCAAHLPSFDTLTLYWAQENDYGIEPAELARLGSLIGTQSDEALKYVQDIHARLLVTP